jgi:hypothetical protein
VLSRKAVAKSEGQNVEISPTVNWERVTDRVMSQSKKNQVTVIYISVLTLFGLFLIFSTIGLFCWLSGPSIFDCMVDAVNPF